MADINQVQLPDGSQYNIKDDVSGYASEAYVQSQISGITKSTIGLGNVDNTSDANKPVSTAQQTALNGKTNTSVIAYVEASATATTKRYEIGDQFILSGVLYTATSIIPNGDPIVIGTNCSASDTITEQLSNAGGSASNITYDNTTSGLTADDVQEGIDELASEKADKADLTSIFETGSTASQAISAGTYFYLDGVLVRAKTAIASGATFTLNTNYEVVSIGVLNEITVYKDLTNLPANGEITSLASTEITNGYKPSYASVISAPQLENVSGTPVISSLGGNRFFTLFLTFSGSTPTITAISSDATIRVFFTKV